MALTIDEVRRTKYPKFEELIKEAREKTGGDENELWNYVAMKTITEFSRKVSEENRLMRGSTNNSDEFNEQDHCVKLEKQKGKKVQENMSEIEQKNPSKRNLTHYDSGEEQPGSMPSKYKENIEKQMNASATDVKLVIAKSLFQADVEQQQNRFSIPSLQLLTNNFLAPDEENEIKKREGKRYRGLHVLFIDPSRRLKTDIYLKKWMYNNSSSYALTKGWYSVVEENRLKKHDEVALWSFRVNGKLGFQLVKVGGGRTRKATEVMQA